MRLWLAQGKDQPPTRSEKMSLIQHRAPLSQEEEFKYAKLAMEWYGWGSPIGLGILLVALAAAAVLVRIAVYGF
ncbi:hypothetical protein D3227_28735 [Mesorhizobium waimense]|uniref:Uncharacterized protein n=2 Tax=Mesorhizobium waimense TaxID=1300307 RepID=A0A3A5K950_9HYPH|nr:hypothetical protein D3227_28735 [Mesorhizobium waimense]